MPKTIFIGASPISLGRENPCPVGAIAPDTRLDPEQLPFVEINASFYPGRPADVKLPPTSKLAPVVPAAEVHVRGQPLTVAIVGSGPAAMYAADELLTQHGVRVNVFEKLPTPYGLVRAGVAPDHQNTKKVTRLFDRVARHRRFRFYLNVEIGKHLFRSGADIDLGASYAERADQRPGIRFGEV